MHLAQVAPLANQVHPVPQHVRPATRESLATNPGTLAKNVPSKPFKIKTPNPVRVAKPAPVGSPTKSKEPAFAKTKDSKKPPIAKKKHTSMTLRSTKTIGIVCRAPLVRPAVETSIGPVCKRNLVGQDATTPMLLLHGVLFQRLVWVGKIQQ